jgi:hypothetical protein
VRYKARLTGSSVCEYCVSGKDCDHGSGAPGAHSCACSLAGATKCPECGCECASWDWGLGFVGPASIRSFFGVGDDENPGFSGYPASKAQLVAAAKAELEEMEDVAPDLEWLTRTLPEGTYKDRGEAIAALSPVLAWPGGDPSRFVVALPMYGIATGAKIVVARDQLAALLGKDGTPLDCFGPGEYVVSRESVPRAAAKSRPPVAGRSRSVIWGVPYFASSKAIQAPISRSGRSRSGEPVQISVTATVSITSLADFLVRSGRRPQGISATEAAGVVTAIVGPTLDQLIASHTAGELAGKSSLVEQAFRAGASAGGLSVSSLTIGSAGAIPVSDQMAAMLEMQKQAMAHLSPEQQAMMQAQMAKAMERAQAARASRAGSAAARGPLGPPGGGPPSAPSICPACKTPNAPGTKFCGSCGQPLIAKTSCPRCHHEVAAGLKFCGNCGSPLAPT